MKKVQRSFAVEYKSGRRKRNAGVNSIWGNLDLTSLSREVDEEAIASVNRPQRAENLSLLADELAEPLLTLSIGQHTTEAAKKGANMADEIDTTINADLPGGVGAPIAEKKQREPRVKKTNPDARSGEVTSGGAVSSSGSAERKKRGRKPKALVGAVKSTDTRMKREPKIVRTAGSFPTAIDEMADLLQLEQENLRLRKLLAEKLRAENADLRKRLNLD